MLEGYTRYQVLNIKYQTPIFHQFSVHVARGCDSILLWRRSDTLCTSGSVDDVMFHIINTAGQFKLYCLVYAIHYGRSPAYLTETVQSVGASRSRCGLRSSYTSPMNYSLPRLRTKFGERALILACGSCHLELTLCPTTSAPSVDDPVKFRKLLKSHYFSQAFNIC